MNFITKTQKILLAGLAFGVLLVTSQCSEESKLLDPNPKLSYPRFYGIVEQNCAAYRVYTNVSQMTLEEESDGSLTFTLQLESRPNNFEEVMMVGYIAAGQAVESTNLNVQTVNIILTIPAINNMLPMTTADISLVGQLLQEEIRAIEFIRQIQWN